MSVCRICTDNQNTGSIFQIIDAVGGRTGSESTLHTQSGRRVAHPCAAVDVVGTDDRTNEFLHEVILLIRTAGRRNSRYAVRTVFGFYIMELGSYKFKGFIPCSFHQLTVFTDERRTYTIFMVIKSEGIASLQTGMSAVHFGIQWCLYAFDDSIHCRYFEVATNTAVGTHRSGDVGSHHTLTFEYIADGAGRTSLCTGTAAHTIAFKKRHVRSLDDAVIESTSRHTEYKLPLDFIAGTYTAIAVDALAEIGGHIGMR